jgi:chromosome segregation ATPase
MLEGDPLGTADATTLPGGGGTLGGTSSDMGGTLGKKKDAAHTESFRCHNVRFLQAQNQEATKSLDRIEEERDLAMQDVQRWEEKRLQMQQEYKKLEQQLAGNEEKCQISAAEIHKRDEQIRLLSDQNRSLLTMLEQEEKTAKDKELEAKRLENRQYDLQNISDQYDHIKETGHQQLTTAYTEIAKFEEELRNAQNETEQLKEAEANFAAQAKVDVEALETKLKEAKKQ